MTDYLDVISLDQAKIYLKIDSGQNETDAEIKQMIGSALSYIEKRTNHIFMDREKVYYKDCALVQRVKVYDYPIKEAPAGTEYTNTFAFVPTVNNFVTLELGYDEVEDIPVELIDAALQLINFWFYNSETQNAMNTVPDFVNVNIDVNRRFV